MELMSTPIKSVSSMMDKNNFFWQTAGECVAISLPSNPSHIASIQDLPSNPETLRFSSILIAFKMSDNNIFIHEIDARILEKLAPIQTSAVRVDEMGKCFFDPEDKFGRQLPESCEK